MTQQTCEKLLSDLSPAEQAQFLTLLGHELTILGRSSYEFQVPGVTNPKLLRDLNEIQHRVHGQLFSLTSRGEPDFAPDLLASWLFAESKPYLQPGLAFAFERAARHFRAAANNSVKPNPLRGPA
jgi:hypothetical protein